jgi:hypothetical protein
MGDFLLTAALAAAATPGWWIAAQAALTAGTLGLALWGAVWQPPQGCACGTEQDGGTR